MQRQQGAILQSEGFAVQLPQRVLTASSSYQGGLHALPHSLQGPPLARIFLILLAQVCFLVSDEVRAPGEVFPTLSAPVRLLPSVCSLVCTEVGDITESPPTLSTLIRPLTRVGPVVHPKAGAVAEALPTLTADVRCWLQVGSVMDSQGGTLTEALATNVTAVWPLAQVILLVCSEV